MAEILPRVGFFCSRLPVQQAVGNVLIHDEGDAACGGHPDQVGKHAFVEAPQALISGREGDMRHVTLQLDHVKVDLHLKDLQDSSRHLHVLRTTSSAPLYVVC